MPCSSDELLPRLAPLRAVGGTVSHNPASRVGCPALLLAGTD